jgi:UDP-glucose 4-epimerase
MYGMVLPRFVAAALGNRPIQVYGDGKQSRCFCHVEDVAGAILALMSSPSAVGEVFNLGSDQEISINDLAKTVVRILGSQSKIEHIPYEVAYGRSFDDLPRRVPDLTRIKRAIGFAPRYSLEQIIRSVADFEQSQGPGKGAA